MTSRSANVLVIFIVAIFAFCFASVFASMTGPIAILPSNNDSDMLLDNVTIADDNLTSNNNYNTPSYTKQTDDTDDNTKDDDKSDVETTVDKTTSNEKTKTSTKTTTDTSKNEVEVTEDTSKSDSSDVETTSED